MQAGVELAVPPEGGGQTQAGHLAEAVMVVNFFPPPISSRHLSGS